MNVHIEVWHYLDITNIKIFIQYGYKDNWFHYWDISKFLYTIVHYIEYVTKKICVSNFEMMKYVIILNSSLLHNSMVVLCYSKLLLLWSYVRICKTITFCKSDYWYWGILDNFIVNIEISSIITHPYVQWWAPTCLYSFHIYKAIWIPSTGEVLGYEREDRNIMDPYVVAISKVVK